MVGKGDLKKQKKSANLGGTQTSFTSKTPHRIEDTFDIENPLNRQFELLHVKKKLIDRMSRNQIRYE